MKNDTSSPNSLWPSGTSALRRPRLSSGGQKGIGTGFINEPKLKKAKGVPLVSLQPKGIKAVAVKIPVVKVKLRP